jgi:hypothetical protein
MLRLYVYCPSCLQLVYNFSTILALLSASSSGRENRWGWYFTKHMSMLCYYFRRDVARFKVLTTLITTKKIGLSSMWRHVVCQNISTFGRNILPPSSEPSIPGRLKVYLSPARQWIATRHGVTSLKCPRCFILLLRPSVLQETEMLRKTWIKRG